MPYFVSGVYIRFVFVYMASCNVYYNFQDIIYIALFRILYVIGYFISSQKLTVLFKIDINIHVCLKKDVSVCIKFLLIIHAHLHLQNSIYLHFLHPQRNDLPKIIDFKIHKQRKKKHSSNTT